MASEASGVSEAMDVDLSEVTRLFADELEGVEVEIATREIGNGPQFALKVYPEDSTMELWESQWFHEAEFEAYLAGMKNLHVLIRKAARERDTDD